MEKLRIKRKKKEFHRDAFKCKCNVNFYLPPLSCSVPRIRLLSTEHAEVGRKMNGEGAEECKNEQNSMREIRIERDARTRARGTESGGMQRKHRERKFPSCSVSRGLLAD